MEDKRMMCTCFWRKKPSSLEKTIKHGRVDVNECLRYYHIVKVKQSHYRPGQALRVPGGWGAQISRQSAHEGGKVVSSTHRPPLPPMKYCWYSFLLEAESTPGPQCGRKDYVHEKFKLTPSGIEPATFRLVAQCLNQLRYGVPRYHIVWLEMNFSLNCAKTLCPNRR